MSSDTTAPPVHGEILTGVQRRRRWSTTEKIRLVEESQQPGSSVSSVARRYGFSPSLLFSWKRRMLEGGHQAVHADEEVVGTSRVRELERRARDLERLLERKTMEVEILKEALDLARTKNRPRRSAPGAVRRAVRGESGRRHAQRGPLPPGRAVEWLSDNGTADIAKETAQRAAALGLRLLFTPVRSPQSYGIAKAFVKTLKRDYARLAILVDAETVMRLLPAWFEDYNTIHSQSGLRMLSPRE